MRACALSCSSRSSRTKGSKRRGNGLASGGVERWAFSGEDAFVRCRTWLVQGVVAAHWQEGGKEGGKQGEVRYSGGGSSVGETVDPGSASRAACPMIRSLYWGVAVICLFFFSTRKLSLISLVETSQISSLSSFFLGHFRARLSDRVLSGKKSRRLYQDNTGEHVHPCERELKSVLERSYTHPYPRLRSSCCWQVTGWCCSNIFKSERSRSICAEMRDICGVYAAKRFNYCHSVLDSQFADINVLGLLAMKNVKLVKRLSEIFIPKKGIRDIRMQ